MNTLLCVYKKLFFLGDKYSKKIGHDHIALNLTDIIRIYAHIKIC